MIDNGVIKNKKFDTDTYLKALELAAESSALLIGQYNFKENTYVSFSNNLGFHKVGDVVLNPEETFLSNGVICRDSKKLFRKTLNAVRKGSPYLRVQIHVKNYLEIDKWYDLGFTTVFGPENEPLLALICGVDITDSKKLEKIYEEELEYQKGSPEDGYLPKVRVNLSQDLIESYSAGKIASVSRAGTRFSLETKKMLKYVFTREQRKSLKHLYSIDEIRERFSRGENQWSVEYQRILKDKSIIWVQTILKVSKNPDTGDLIGFIYIHNINLRKIKEIALKTLASRNYDSIGIINVKTREFIRFDKDENSTETFSYSEYLEKRSSLNTSNLFHFLSAEDYRRVTQWVQLDNIKSHLETSHTCEYYYKTKTPDGAGIITYKLGAFYIDDTKSHILVFRSNVTAAVKNEQKIQLALKEALVSAESANEEKSNFITRINRDLRTPANAIAGFADLSLDTDDINELKKNIHKIKDASNYLVNVINDMLKQDSSSLSKDMEKIKEHTIMAYDELFAKILVNKRILLCEDHPLNAEVAMKILERKGCICEHVWNGADAISTFSSKALYYYDAILMDVQMPILDGLAATRRIRCLEREDASTIPIIAMTASAYESDIAECFDAGMNAHLAKPIEKMELFEVLEKAINISEKKSNA